MKITIIETDTHIAVKEKQIVKQICKQWCYFVPQQIEECIRTKDFCSLLIDELFHKHGLKMVKKDKLKKADELIDLIRKSGREWK